VGDHSFFLLLCLFQLLGLAQGTLVQPRLTFWIVLATSSPAKRKNAQRTVAKPIAFDAALRCGRTAQSQAPTAFGRTLQLLGTVGNFEPVPHQARVFLYSTLPETLRNFQF